MTLAVRTISLLLGVALLGPAVPVAAQAEARAAITQTTGEPQLAQPEASDAPAAELEPGVEAAPPPERSSLPELPADLRRRMAPEMPLFAGPASLRVSGAPGAHRWPEVRFGAQEVRLKVALTPAGESCAAHVRLVDEDGPVFDERFSAEGGTREGREVVLDVDYATGRLKLDTDCERWTVRFAPEPDPDLELTIVERPYRVRGADLDALKDQTSHIDGKWAAYTEWFTSWAFEPVAAEDGGSCAVVGGRTEVEVTLTSPRWVQPADVDPAVVAEWERFAEALAIHELGHVTIALQGADAIDDRLDKGFTAPTCEEARAAADERATEIFERYSRLSRHYDRETEHGLEQGTGLG